MEMRHQLTDQLKRLKMPGLSHALDMRLAESRINNLGHLEFLSLLIQDELVNREDNMLSKRLKAACPASTITTGRRQLKPRPLSALPWGGGGRAEKNRPTFLLNVPTL